MRQKKKISDNRNRMIRLSEVNLNTSVKSEATVLDSSANCSFTKCSLKMHSENKYGPSALSAIDSIPIFAYIFNIIVMILQSIVINWVSERSVLHCNIWITDVRLTSATANIQAISIHISPGFLLNSMETILNENIIIYKKMHITIGHYEHSGLFLWR